MLHTKNGTPQNELKPPEMSHNYIKPLAFISKLPKTANHFENLVDTSQRYYQEHYKSAKLNLVPKFRSTSISMKVSTMNS